MVEPNFYAPTPGTLDFSPILQGAQIQAAHYAAAGQVLGATIASAAKAKSEERAQEQVDEAAKLLAQESSYADHPFRPIDTPAFSRVKAYMDEFAGDPRAGVSMLVRDGVASEAEATGIIEDAMRERPIRYLKPEARAKLLSVTSKLQKAGVDPGAFQQIINEHGAGRAHDQADAIEMAYASSAALLTPRAIPDRERQRTTFENAQTLEILGSSLRRAEQEAERTGSEASQLKVIEAQARYRLAEQAFNQDFDRQVQERNFDYESLLMRDKQAFESSEADKARALDLEIAGMRIVSDEKQAEIQAGARGGGGASEADIAYLDKLSDLQGAGPQASVPSVTLTPEELPIFDDSKTLLKMLQQAGGSTMGAEALTKIRLSLDSDGELVVNYTGSNPKGKAIAQTIAGTPGLRDELADYVALRMHAGPKALTKEELIGIRARARRFAPDSLNLMRVRAGRATPQASGAPAIRLSPGGSPVFNTTDYSGG